MKILKNITVFTLVMMLSVSTGLEARDKKGVSNFSSSSSNYVDSSGSFDGNKIYVDVTNNGLFFDSNVTGNSALEWPQGTGVHSIYASALWMGAKVNGETRTIIGTFTQDMGPGPYGGDPLAAVHRVYKVEKSMLASPLDFADFQEWPAEYGAPWVDVDGDGVYTPLPNGTDHPEFLGDQVLWFVSTDEDEAYKLNIGTRSMGVEVQTTMFGFDRPDVFGDMLFLKLLVINKGENELTDTYMGIWSDPDLGSASDDLVGCDVELGLGYVYNSGEDPYYSELSTGTPAAGYDFFQGPMVDCDATEDCSLGAKMFGTRHPGKKNLQMSSYAFYINSDPVYTDPDDETEAYYYMQGLRKDGSAYPSQIAGCANVLADGSCETDADGNENLLNGGKFVFSGDPNAPHSLTNPVDGNYAVAADRRFLMNVGPFTMAQGDSQEVVFGVLHAAGGDPLSSVAYLKEVDILAQKAYDIDFALPDSPPSPKVTASAFSDAIILTWDGAAENYSAVSDVDLDASGNPTTFEFEGYNVYQHETAQGGGATKRLATYDVINDITEIYDTVFNAELGENINIRTQFGSDSGLSKFHSVSSDGLKGNTTLITNRAYYFSVTAYGYNPDGIPKTLESTPKYITVRPEVSNTQVIGEDTGAIGATIAATHVGPSGGSVEAVIVDPKSLVEDTYTVSFSDTFTKADGSTVSAVNWSLTNSAGEKLVDSSPVVGGVNTVTNANLGTGSVPVVDGIQVQVNGPQLNTVTDVSEYTAGWKENDELRDPAVGYMPFYSLGTTGYILENRAGELDGVNVVRDHDRFNYWEADDFEIDFSTPSLAWNYASNYVMGTVPFSLYRHNFSTGVKEPVYAAYLDWDGNGVFNGATGILGPLFQKPGWDPIYGYAAFDTDGDGVRDFYDPSKVAQYIVDDNAFVSGGCGWGAWSPNANPDHYNDEWGCPKLYTSMTAGYIDTPMMTATVFTDYLDNGYLPDDAGIASGAYNAGNWTGASSVVLITAKPNSSKDTYSFSTEGMAMATVDYDPDNISVWPNPYYGYNPEERDALDRRVMFSHLPEEGPATIRIFALDGTLVRTIHHNDTASQHATWDMKNNFELPVASGMYVAHVETNHGDKILKLAVIQPEQRLDVY